MAVHYIKGPTIRLISGKYFDLQDPEASTYDITDIAHALSNLCRFTGHCSTFYSVAQHSVLVSSIVPPADRLAGLLHDAAEAFIGDVTTPLKNLLPEYRVIEKRIERAVLARFGLAPELPASVKVADKVVLRTEQRDLCNADADHWQYSEGVVALRDRILCWSPALAREAFLNHFNQLQCQAAR